MLTCNSDVSFLPPSVPGSSARLVGLSQPSCLSLNVTCWVSCVARHSGRLMVLLTNGAHGQSRYSFHVAELRGFLKGINTEFKREAERI